MPKISLALFIVILTFSCGSPQAEKTSNEVKTGTKEPVETRDLLGEYETYLADLDTNSEKSVSAAVDKYTELFSKSNRELCDSAFVAFHELYEKIENRLDYTVYTNPVYAELPCVSYDENGKELPTDKQLTALENRIKKHGFRLECWEGFPGIGGERAFIAKNFYPFVSPVMKQFLEGLRKEKDHVFSVDAGLAVSETEFADRLVWWETFNTNNPDFILAKRATFIQKYLFTFFLTGMDNTPSVNYPVDENAVERMELDAYFVKAYEYLNKKYPGSPSNALVKPYKMAVLKNDRAKSEQLIRTYTKRNLIIDFSKDSEFRY